MPPPTDDIAAAVPFAAVPSAAREQVPRFIEPTLASGCSDPSELLDDGWAMEVKWDGVRAQFASDGPSWWLRTRPGRECASEFPELAELAAVLRGRRLVLDGELVCLNGAGNPDFAALRARLGRSGRLAAAAAQRNPVTLLAFDALHLDGRSTRALPYWRRRELLDELGLAGPAWRAPRHFVGEGESVLTSTAELGLEGVVAKRLDAPYAAGRRTSAWRKVKHRRRERFVVTGWRERDGGLPEFLLTRRDEDGTLSPAGSASLGLDRERRAALIEVLAANEVRRRGRRRGAVRWVAPVVEVSADVHGAPDGPVRDAVLREVCTSPPQRHGHGQA